MLFHNLVLAVATCVVATAVPTDVSTTNSGVATFALSFDYHGNKTILPLNTALYLNEQSAFYCNEAYGRCPKTTTPGFRLQDRGCLEMNTNFRYSKDSTPFNQTVYVDVAGAMRFVTPYEGIYPTPYKEVCGFVIADGTGDRSDTLHYFPHVKGRNELPFYACPLFDTESIDDGSYQIYIGQPIGGTYSNCKEFTPFVHYVKGSQFLYP